MRAHELFIHPYAKRPGKVPGTLPNFNKFLLKMNERGENESGGKRQSRLSVKIINRKAV